MQNSDTKDLLSYLDKLIADGEELHKKQFKVATSSYTSKQYVPIDELKRWHGNCLVLETKMGDGIKPWRESLSKGMPNELVIATALLGTVRSIRDAVAGGHLTRFVDVILAETFSDLLEQAHHLHSKGYWLAAGVLGRAVLEEALRKRCESVGCSPNKERPTLADFNVELYKAGHYDKIEHKLIDMLATIGNDCAHNTSSAGPSRVQHLLEQLPPVLARI